MSKKDSIQFFFVSRSNIKPEMENNCDSWCRTASGNTAKCTFKWTIQHFLERKEQRGEYIESTIFSVTGSDDKETKWFLEFFPKGRDLYPVEADDYMSVYLYRTFAST